MPDSTPASQIDDLSKDDLLKLVPDFLHRIVVHYALWFTEVRHQMGLPKALEMLDEAFGKSLGVQMKRLGETLGFKVVDGLPEALTKLDQPALLALIDAVAKNWLANDGIWFQAVEFSQGMNDAKRCNDSCWGHFSPFEAFRIKRLLGLGETPGLEGLARALNFRVYARLNTQNTFFENDHTLIFQMNVCRVQEARQRKGMADYPCKSGGLVEYAYFARSIDSRITSECIGCPPDAHPADWFCAWRFKIAEKSVPHPFSECTRRGTNYSSVAGWNKLRTGLILSPLRPLISKVHPQPVPGGRSRRLPAGTALRREICILPLGRF